MKLRAVFLVQRIIATFAVAVPGRSARITWVVGVDELAGMLSAIASVVPGSHSVQLGRHAFYNNEYGTSIATRGGRLRRALSAYLRAPWVFGRLARAAEGFIYLGSAGFLEAGIDDRRFEFGLLRRKGVRIVCFFLGDDIRAPRLMHELERSMGRPNASTRVGDVAPIFESDEYDQTKRRIARVADEFADAVFSAPVDQSSYLVGPIHPFMYFYPDADVGTPRHEPTGRLTVLHAPSNPIIKGTPAVREAIDVLRAEGLDFDYRELIGVPNAQVRAALTGADIVLNQFYTFVPGVFGVESLAAGAAVLMSADEALEPALPAGSHEAWVVTRPDQIAENLRGLLNDRARIAQLSQRGVQWVRDHAVASRNGALLRDILTSVLAAPPRNRPSAIRAVDSDHVRNRGNLGS